MNPNRADWKLLAIAIVTAILAVIASNAASMIGLAAIPSAIVACFRRFFDCNKRNIKMRFVAYGGCALLATSGPSGCALNTFRAEKTAVPIITALEQHRMMFGSYPEQLETVASPKCSACTDGKFHYSKRNKSDQYDLTCVTFGFNKHTYESKSQKWNDWD